MKLFLSSENVGNYQDIFIKLFGNKRIAYIVSAKDYLDEKDRKLKILEHRTQFKSYGIDFKEIDLRDYFATKVPLEILDDFDAVWCPGGNTFLLRSAMKQSGIDEILVKKITDNQIVYGGSSAGSVVVGPTLHGTENGDNPGLVKEIYGLDIEWSGLGITDFVVIPHVESDWFGIEAEKMKQYLVENNIKYREVKDGQVVLVNGSEEKFLE